MPRKNVRQTTDIEHLKTVIHDRGLVTTWVLKQAGITYQQYYRVTKNTREFTVGEAAALSKVLSLTSKERDSIFFAREV